MTEHHLDAVEMRTGRLVRCSVTIESGARASIRVRALGNQDPQDLRVEGRDVEEALLALRTMLEDRGLLLLCNRFPRDAFTTSLSRQMSDGRRCYLVVPHRPVDPARTVDCLGPADRSEVVTREAAEAYLEEWRRTADRPAPVRWAAAALGSWGRRRTGSP